MVDVRNVMFLFSSGCIFNFFSKTVDGWGVEALIQDSSHQPQKAKIGPIFVYYSQATILRRQKYVLYYTQATSLRRQK